MTIDSMTRRDFLVGGALSIATTAVSSPGIAADSHPNIILIMADDLGYGDLGCYGNGAVRTPNIDRLARGGVRFTDFHSNGAVCSPTRAALLTGCYQQRIGIEGVVTAKNHRHTGLDLAEETFAEVLKRAGYATGLFGKWHLGYEVEFNPVKQGFDEFRGYVSGNIDYHSHIDQEGYEDWWAGAELTPETGYTTDLVTHHGADFINRHAPGPFCLYLAHEAPHYPYQGPRDRADRTPGYPEPIQGSRENRKAAYREMIESLDDGVGKILNAVKRAGIERNTFIFFCSDNGATKVGLNAPLKGWKATLYEGGHRVPAIASWPGTIGAGVVTAETCMTMDLFPTLTGLAGVDPADIYGVDGVSLVPVLRDGGTLPGRPLFWRFNDMKAVRDGSWKLVMTGTSTYLYDLSKDLREQNDLAGLNPDRVSMMKTMLTGWENDVDLGVVRRT